MDHIYLINYCRSTVDREYDQRWIDKVQENVKTTTSTSTVFGQMENDFI